ncbi:MAG: SPFH domain-containing protein [Oscillospiraceae bacterium]|nr:SPFH domain-containing protein [Oscillospiraceae bacterium]
MAKFVIRCSKCGTVHQASTSLFAKKIIHCGVCGKDIDVKAEKLTARVCPHCKNTFFYDQSKGRSAKCPACNHEIENMFDATKISTKAADRLVSVNCPTCACAVEVRESEEFHFCPLCDTKIDIQHALVKAKLVSTTGVSVIQYEGDNSVFVWKHPIEDFNMGSQLIVHESQEAIFFMNGQALDLFGPGRHTLETENMPVLKQIYHVPTGSQTPFHAEVYFINKTVQMGLKWGTDTRVRFIDPASGIPLDIGAAGEMNMQVCDSRKLLTKLVGTTQSLAYDEMGLKNFFRAPLMTEIKSYLASTIKQQQLDIMAIDEQLGILSDALKNRIAPKLEEYGITIPQFYVSYISLPQDENFAKLQKMRADSYIKVREKQLETELLAAEQKRAILEAQTAAQLEYVKAQGTAEAAKVGAAAQADIARTKGMAEADVTRAQGMAAAEVARAQGLAEAETMQAKGYTQKDVLAADVQKAYAEGMGQLGSNAGGGSTGSGGGFVNDMLGLAAGMKVAGTVFEKMEFPDLSFDSKPAAAPAASAAGTWACDCGESGNTGKFCMNCGKPKPESWDCTACGHKGNKGKFCEECGAPKQTSWDCACGQKGNTGKCCPECGARRPG